MTAGLASSEGCEVKVVSRLLLSPCVSSCPLPSMHVSVLKLSLFIRTAVILD